jgi:hypothetical protein
MIKLKEKYSLPRREDAKIFIIEFYFFASWRLGGKKNF